MQDTLFDMCRKRFRASWVIFLSLISIIGSSHAYLTGILDLYLSVFFGFKFSGGTYPGCVLGFPAESEPAVNFAFTTKKFYFVTETTDRMRNICIRRSGNSNSVCVSDLKEPSRSILSKRPINECNIPKWPFICINERKLSRAPSNLPP